MSMLVEQVQVETLPVAKSMWSSASSSIENKTQFALKVQIVL
jgi:hypothetical protein